MKPKDNSHKYFMNLALKEAKQALFAGEFPVGCVMVCDNQLVASGSRERSSGDCPNELDHAEMVTLRKLTNLKGFNAYSRVSVYCTMEPCLMCYAALILSGIRCIVWAYEDVMGGGTQCDLNKLPPLYAGSRVSIIPYFCRQESLEIFKRFFSDANNGYWKGSLLAEYTLKQ
ncbi:MAG: nucleoside deaminase [Desulfobacterales bacterium]